MRLVPLDLEVAERLRRIDKPKLLVVNKCDSTRTDAEVHEFRRLVRGPLVVTSVKANRNRDELSAAIVEHAAPAVRTWRISGRRGPVGRAGAEAGDCGPPERRQKHVHQRAGRERTGHRQRNPRDDAGQRRHPLRRRRQAARWRSIRPAFASGRAWRPTWSFMVWSAPSGASGGPTWCSCSSTRRRRFRASTFSSSTKSPHSSKPCVFVVNKWDSVPENDDRGLVGIPAADVRHACVTCRSRS